MKRIAGIFLTCAVVLITGCATTTETNLKGELIYNTHFNAGNDQWKSACSKKHGIEVVKQVNNCIASLKVEENAYVVSSCEDMVMNALCPIEVEYYKDVLK